MTGLEMYRVLDAIAPFDSQADFDNSGFLVGDPAREIHGVLLALDVTENVIDEALAAGAGLIITHHPLLFSPLSRLTEEDYEGRLIRRLTRENISLIAAHTNLDQAPGGINDALACLCGLTDVRGDGFFRMGELAESMSSGAYAAFLAERLGDTIRLMGPADVPVRRVGLSSGGGGDEWRRAAEAGCDLFVSGEIKHHLALAMADLGIVACECGHYATEYPGMAVLAEALQNALREIECSVRVFLSEARAYGFPRKT